MVKVHEPLYLKITRDHILGLKYVSHFLLDPIKNKKIKKSDSSSFWIEEQKKAHNHMTSVRRATNHQNSEMGSKRNLSKLVQHNSALSHCCLGTLVKVDEMR